MSNNKEGYFEAMSARTYIEREEARSIAMKYMKYLEEAEKRIKELEFEIMALKAKVIEYENILWPTQDLD